MNRPGTQSTSPDFSALKLLLTSSICLLVLSATPAKADTAAPKYRPLLPGTTPQDIEGGFWRVDRNFEPMLHLKNILLHDALDVKPVLYLADGTEYKLAPVHVVPAGVASVNIRTALTELPAELAAHRSAFGTLAVRYQWSWRALQANVQITDEIDSLSFHSDLRTFSSVAHGKTTARRTINGLWWHPTQASGGFLALVNTSLAEQQVSLGLSTGEGFSLSANTLTLPPHTTQMLSLATLLGAHLASVGDAGSMSLTYTGPQDSVLAYGGIEDDAEGYSATMPMWETHPELHAETDRPVSIYGAGLMVGAPETRMQFPVSTVFKPYAIVHNVSTKALDVTLGASDGSAVAASVSLGSVHLLPGQTSEIDLTKRLSSSGFVSSTGYLNLQASFTGQEQDLQITEGSVDQTGSYVFEVPPRVGAPAAARILCFWTINGDNNSMISLWNYTAKSRDFSLTLMYQGGQYVLPVHLAANESRNLDMPTVIRQQQPDASGSVIPSNVTEGSAVVMSGADSSQSFPLAVNVSTFNVRNATCAPQCATCNGVSAFFLPNLNPPLVVGSSRGLFAEVVYNDGTNYPISQGYWDTINSGNPESVVLTIDSSGTATAYAGGRVVVVISVVGLPADAGYVCSGGQALSCPLSNFSTSGEMLVSGQIVGLYLTDCRATSTTGLFILGYQGVKNISCNISTTAPPLGYAPLQRGGRCVMNGPGSNNVYTYTNGQSVTTVSGTPTRIVDNACLNFIDGGPGLITITVHP